MADKNLGKWVKLISVGSSFTVTLAGLAIGGYFLGRFLDLKLGIFPVFTILLMLAGVILGVIYLVWSIMKLEKSKDE
ncbi:AtpZ/AtpI family protein [Dehalobacter sp. DCM]|uniref:AtpZ/AtpI family protein n=1 Tax=Dehalobacter sp. DCM TaxID=2907827 RepID=UPI003081D561|nr:AtpZ/AtpI family protein [Dehalobacter sp. DCM]